ncbi:hypothetical protein, partial [Leptospira interrogans]|uniref:hypothetical protein n=1 Tax=Leptospira interrogans TaxID=173 RepID=UPI001F395B91
VPETPANIFFFLSFSPFTSILGKKGVYFYVTRSVCDLFQLYYILLEPCKTNKAEKNAKTERFREQNKEMKSE